MPDAILEHHASFSAGILPAAALSAIGTIRSHTHQVLGQFHGGLDAAFIAHRALIPRPDDAEMHLIELVADSLHHLMLVEGVRAHLSDELCIARLKELPAVKEMAEPALNQIITCISGFSTSKIDVIRQALGMGLTDSYPEKRFIEALYGHQSVADASRKEMAFLHDFTRSHLQKTIRDNPPRLTLGTVVAVRRNKTYDFQLCIQPRCDSVRFERIRSFPFTRLLDSEQPNIHLHWNGVFRAFASSEKLFDIKVLEFGGEADATSAVQAQLDPEIEKWYFQGTRGQRLYWVGDLRKDKAQRVASKIASRLHMPGINEYEPARQPD
ncbi:hypothetical protein D3C84_678020 [compost metagenome]